MVDDIGENNVPIGEAFKTRGKEVLKNLKRKAMDTMSGSGFCGSSGKRKKKNQSESKSQKKKTSKKVSGKNKNKNKNKDKKKTK